MSRIPNPFLCGEMQPKHPHTPSTPGFLMMTRPPMGANAYGGRGGRTAPGTPHRQHFTPTGNFIPFSGAHSDRRGRQGGGGGGGHRASPRLFSPYQQPPPPYQPSPIRGAGAPMGYPGGGQGTPFNPSRHSGNRDSFGAHGNNRPNRFSHNGGSRGGGGRDHRGPISDIPVDKFVTAEMMGDPWAEFDVPADTPNTSAASSLERTPTLPLGLLDDSEIIIDSDTSGVMESGGGGGVGEAASSTASSSVVTLKRTSTDRTISLDNSDVVVESDTSSVVVLEDSYDDGGGTEGDSSPVPDTGSESPYVVTSSTSDKDGDSTGDD